MKLFSSLRLLHTRSEIDRKIISQRGTFASRSPKDLDSIFGISFQSLSTTKPLDLGESSLDRLSLPTQEYFLNSLYRYNATFPAGQGLSKDFDGFTGNEHHMDSIIEYFFRTLVVATYEEGVSLGLKDPIIMHDGTRKGNYDLVVNRAGLPILVVRFAKFNPNIRGSNLEQGFCGNIFEIYANYWKNRVWPVFGCVTDLNSWIFLKFDGENMYRDSKVYKLALHNTAILSLANKILNVIDSKVV